MNRNVADILPHDKPMVLIDNVVKVDLKEKYITAEVKIKDDMIFYDKNIKGVSSLVGIEFMAQTIGAYSFYKNHEKEPKIGFLLGTRLYNNAIDYFHLGKTYTIKAVEIFDNNGIVSFECFIYNCLQEECASATLNVYQDDAAKGLLENGEK